MKSKLERKNEQLSALYSIALDLLNDREVEGVLNKIILRASELLESPIGFLDLLDGDTLVIKATTELVKYHLGKRVPLAEAKLTAKAIETRQPQIVHNYLKRTKRIKAYDPHQMKAASTFPIVVNDIAVGALSFGRTKPNHNYTKEDLDTMRALAQLAGLAFQNANMFEETVKQSVTDSLTELANRRQFDLTLAQEWKHAQRDKISLALILVDIDYFKIYNDTYGHTHGDECLKRVAKVLSKAGRRPYDLAARYGGEEFAIILPNINLTNAKKRAEFLRKEIKALGIPHKGSKIASTVTISLGVATIIPEAEDEAMTLISHADEALYNAKHSGRNRVRVYSKKK